MFTKAQLLQAIPDVPAEFSLRELEAILNRPSLGDASPNQPVNSTDSEHYTSPEALALYAKFAVSPEVAAMRGIAARLSPVDRRKSAKEWEAERIREKYGV